MRLQDLLASFFLSTVFYHTVIADRVSCPRVSLRNGRVKLRARGKMAYFKCKKRYTRLGDKFAVCLQSGKWSHAVPLCISKGCPSLGSLPGMEVTESYDGAMLKFRCPVGTQRNGPETITCDGNRWSDKAPFCESGLTLSCDFEKEGLCGWSQDETDNFDWTRKSGQTPTMHTGPQGDHTTGSGHYMFIESSSPRKVGDVARLISPIYPNTLKYTCFAFWYHMKGPGDENDVGSLEVFVKPETAVLGDIDPEFYMEGHQGDDWIRGFFKIPDQDENFQIIIVGTRKEGFVSDIALDDLRIYNCSEVTTTMATTKATTLPRTTTRAPTTVVTRKRTTVPETPTIPPTRMKTSSATPSPPTSIPSTRKPKRTTSMPSVTTPMKKTPRSTRVTKAMKRTTTKTTPMPRTTIKKRRTTFPKTTAFVTRKTRPTAASQTKRRRPKKTTVKSVTKAMTTQVKPSSKPEVTTVFGYKRPSGGTSNVSRTPKKPKLGTKVTTIKPLSSQKSLTGKSSTTSGNDLPTPKSSTIDTNSTHNVTDISNNYPTANPKETKRSTDKSPSILPLVIGITAGIVVGMIVIGILAWMWARSQRKKKEREAAEDEMYMLSTGEAAAYNFK